MLCVLSFPCFVYFSSFYLCELWWFVIFLLSCWLDIFTFFYFWPTYCFFSLSCISLFYVSFLPVLGYFYFFLHCVPQYLFAVCDFLFFSINLCLFVFLLYFFPFYLPFRISASSWVSLLFHVLLFFGYFFVYVCMYVMCVREAS